MGNLTERLKGVELFTGLTEEKIEKVLSLGREVKWEQGDTICSEGEPGETIFIIYSGSVKVSKRLTLQRTDGEEDQSQKVLINMDATEPILVGEVSMLTRPERSATITATKGCTGLEIYGSDLRKLCETDSLLGYTLISNLASILCNRLRQANRDVVRLATALSVALG
ncbi:MAG: cyclic nucleotide-binding domain-containing protein [Dehalococcoidia bacterium]|nr:cyclic nucleotide-binding domain-containing protein [Dehalococcoidia bacterium]